MELEEAASRIQALINFHKGLKHLEEVVEVARAANSLQKERANLAEKARIELLDAQGRLTDFYRQSKKTMEETTIRLSELESKFKNRAAELDLALTSKQESVNREMQKASEAYTSTMTDFAAQEKAAQARLDDLTKKVFEMEKLFSILQSKAAKLGA